LNIARAIRRAVDTGKVVLGERETLRYARKGKAKLVVIASNCRASALDELRSVLKDEARIYRFQGAGADLGSVCGKPFPVSMIGILDAGESEILEAVRG
jgi:large subunit ribosomal protein L30e